MEIFVMKLVPKCVLTPAVIEYPESVIRVFWENLVMFAIISVEIIASIEVVIRIPVFVTHA